MGRSPSLCSMQVKFKKSVLLSEGYSGRYKSPNLERGNYEWDCDDDDEVRTTCGTDVFFMRKKDLHFKR